MIATLISPPVSTPNPTSDTLNREAALARDFVNQTDRHLFLTGRAGTGKTTFLHRLREQSPKQLAVVAPTGVAAINARGVTIHSLFQLPFGNLTPERLRTEMGKKRFRKEKVRLLRGLDLLVIDEVSMVRADVLDAIDYVLQRYRRSRRPFGGVQLLLIGDLHQLPPVVRRQDWEELREHYDSHFFFGSRALQRAGLVTVELTHIYRQSDRDFIDLLNRVRRNDMSPAVLQRLNDRYMAGYRPPENDGTITLTSHRHTADRTNAERLAELTTDAQVFSAEIDGTFPESMYPTDEHLELKVGAQVMFIKNDTSAEKKYYNGKIGRITALRKGYVTVTCPDGERLETGAVEWTNQKYALDETTKEVQEEVLGTFKQVPFRLAWAVTIHKSQGLTFDKVVIDAAAAFAHGQVYVALSRCRSLEGIVLNSRIGTTSVRTDETVDRYTRRARAAAPDAAALAAAKADFRRSLVRALFDFDDIRRSLEQVRRFVLEKESAFVQSPVAAIDTILTTAEQALFGVATKFAGPLDTYLRTVDWTAAALTLDGRPRKAVDYFGRQMIELITTPLTELDRRSDNQAVKERSEELFGELQTALRVKHALLKLAQAPFTDHGYLRARTHAALGEAPARLRKPDYVARRKQAAAKHAHPACLARLTAWRDEVAIAEGKKPYRIVPTRAMDAVAAALPRTPRELLKVEGMGGHKGRLYGEAMLEIVNAYAEQRALPDEQRHRPAPPRARGAKDSAQTTLEMYNTGVPIAEIAKTRNLSEDTVYGHLTGAVGRGKISIREFVAKADQQQIEAYLEAHPDEHQLSAVKRGLQDAYSYGVLRMVREVWTRRQV